MSESYHRQTGYYPLLLYGLYVLIMLEQHQRTAVSHQRSHGSDIGEVNWQDRFQRRFSSHGRTREPPYAVRVLMRPVAPSMQRGERDQGLLSAASFVTRVPY